MKSCAHFNNPEMCAEHRRLIADYQRKFGLPVKSMCNSCRKAHPDSNPMELLLSEELLQRMREAGAC